MMMSSSILRRLFSQNTNTNCCRRKLYTAAVNRELVEPSSPWLMLPPSCIGGGSDVVYNLYSPMKDKILSFNNRGGKEEAQLIRSDKTFLVGSSHGWLAMYNSGKHEIFLCNPLSGRRIPLPPLVGKPFRDQDEDLRPMMMSGMPLRDKKEEVRFPWKVILSCSPLDEDCRALMILSSCDRAAFCLPGRSSEWSPLGRWFYDPWSVKTFNDHRFYTDFVYSAAEKNFLGYVFCLSRFEQELEGWDVANGVRPRTVRLDRFGLSQVQEVCCLSGSCIVSGEEPDQLFLVKRVLLVKFKEKKFNLIVYKIKDGELELCSSLDDLVMFVGINHSVVVRASQFPGLKPNSIYVSEARNLYVGQFVGVFDYQNKTWSPVYHSSLLQTDTDASPQPQPKPQLWFTPTLD